MSYGGLMPITQDSWSMYCEEAHASYTLLIMNVLCKFQNNKSTLMVNVLCDVQTVTQYPWCIYSGEALL